MIEYLVSLSLLICVVLLIRGIFRKTVSPRAIYALWLVVVIRMLLPVTLFEVDVTLPEFLQSQQAEQSERLPEDLQTSADTQEQSSTTSPIPTAPTYSSQNPSSVIPGTPVTPAVPTETTPAAPIISETEVDTPLAPEEPISKVPEEPVSVNWKRIADLVWFIGAVIAAIWVLFTSIIYNGRLMKERRLHRTVRGTKVYVSEGAGVPCIAGLIPSIYITPDTANSKSEMLIIIHEHVHLRHGDHIWAFIRALALIVFWWNPLVWAAATVSKLDAELACDDAISAKLNDETRLRYAHILLDTIPQKHRYAVGLGSAPMKERILMLTKKQKNRWICMILAVVLTVSAVGCSFIGTRKITMDNIQEQNGFTILSQETKEITLSLPLEQLPTYDDIVSAEGAHLELEDIPVFTTDTTEVFLHTAGVSGHKPEGTDKDKLYLGFDIRHNLTDSGTVYIVNRVMNENGSNTYSPKVSVTEETLEKYDRKILHMSSGPNDQFYLYIDAELYTTLQGNLNIGITLNEIIYERGSEVKTYGLNAAEDDTSEPDRNEQQTETFISMDAYVTDRMAKETTAQYYTYGPDGKSISSQSKTANVIDTKLLRLEKKGELTGLAAEGILECWEYEYLIKLDVPTEEIIPVGGQYGEDGWFDLTGQGNHITVALRYPNDTYTVLRDTCVGDGIDFMGYHDTYEEAIYDWYVKEYALDLPLYVQDWADKITVPDGGHLGNQPVHRFDGDGWSIYIPLSAWYQSTDAGENEWLWRSSYLTGSTLLVEAFSDAKESETPENTQTDGTYSHTYDYDNPNGGFWRVTISWTEEGITDYPYIAIEPQLLKLMAESFIVFDESNTVSSIEELFQSILENKVSFALASSKENMLLSEYKIRNEYSVKKYTVLDLNDDMDPEMVLWLGYYENDYAGFLVLHRDGDTVYAHGFPYRGFNGLNGAGVYTSSSSAFNMSILKLDFDGDTCTETELARREGDGSPESVMYYIEDRIGTAEEFEAYFNRYNLRGIPDWYSYDIEEITDIDDWHNLLWAKGLPDTEDRQPSQNVYSFIRELVSGESEIPEINGLGIKDYSIALLKESVHDSLFRFTFTVTGVSLPETLLPGTYTWTLLDGMELVVYTEDVPINQEEATAYANRMRGLDRFEGNSAVQAVNTYLSWMPYIWEVSPYGEWDSDNVHIPYNYICAYYGNENLEIGFDEMQRLMSEKFGIAVERPTDNRVLLSRCKYNKETDTIYYADTRGYEAVHRFLDVREEDGITYVIVQLFADRHRLIPSHKVQYKIGEGEVFLGCEIIQTGNYEMRELS